MFKYFSQKNKNVGILKNGHFHLMVPFMIAFCGCISQGYGAANDTYPIWKEGSQNLNVVSLKDISPSTFGDVSEHWKVVLSKLEERIEIVGFPGQNRANGERRGYTDYRPAFPKGASVDSVILTCSGNANFLDFWTKNGFSSHLLVDREGKLFVHADVLENEKGQMAGAWNNRSLQVVFIDNGDQICSLEQQAALKGFLDILEKSKFEFINLNLKYAGSIWDAKQVQRINPEQYTNGKVFNISDVQGYLGLGPLKA